MDVVNVKCEQGLAVSMWKQRGIYSVYHMDKEHWLARALGGMAAENKRKVRVL